MFVGGAGPFFVILGHCLISRGLKEDFLHFFGIRSTLSVAMPSRLTND